MLFRSGPGVMGLGTGVVVVAVAFALEGWRSAADAVGLDMVTGGVGGFGWHRFFSFLEVPPRGGYGR